jgi:hypothetical protein
MTRTERASAASFCREGAWRRVLREEVTMHKPCIEPSLDELLADPAARILMRRDGVTESQVRAVIGAAQRARAAAPRPALQP